MSHTTSSGSTRTAGAIENAGREIAAPLRQVARHSRISVVNRATVVAMALVAFDCLLVAHYQVDVALSIARWTPPLTLLVGVMLNIGVHVLLLLALWYLGRGALGSTGQTTGASLSHLIGGIFLLAVLSLLAPVDGLGLWNLVLAALAIWVAVLVWQDAGRSTTKRRISVLVIIAIGLYALITGWRAASAVISGGDAGLLPSREAISRPFVPAEVIEIRGEDVPALGYVLDVGATWTTILSEEERKIEIVRSRDIQDRFVCAIDHAGISADLSLVEPIPSTPCDEVLHRVTAEGRA